MTDHILHVSIVTPRTTAYNNVALAVSVPGAQSPFQVLYNHAPIISALETGVVKIEDPNNHVEYFASREGFVEVLKNNITIVVNDLVSASAIDLSMAESDRLAAKSQADSHPDKHVRETARKELHWAEARLQAAKLAGRTVA